MPLHTETSYLLDCAMELGQLSPLEYGMVFYDRNLAEVVDTACGRAESMEGVINLIRSAVENAMPDTRRTVALLAAPSLRSSLRFFRDAINAHIQRKAMDDVGIEKRPRFQFLGLEETSSDEVIFSSVADIDAAHVERYVTQEFGAALTRWHSDLREIEEAIAWARTTPRHLWMPAVQETFVQIQSLRDEYVLHRTASISSRFSKKEVRSARGAIRKVLKLFERSGNTEAVRAFVSGGEVEVSHPSSPFKFVLKPYTHTAGWLIERTNTQFAHSPMNIMLMTKENVHLANLCVYVSETPVLDQVFAFMLYIHSGEEDVILSAANWFGVEQREVVVEFLQSNNKVELLPKLGKRFQLGPERTAVGSDIQVQLTDALERLHPGMAAWEQYKAPVNQWLQRIMVPESFRFLFEPLPVPIPGQQPPVALAA